MDVTGRSMTRREALSRMALPITAALTTGLIRGRVEAAVVGDPAPDDHPLVSNPYSHRSQALDIYYIEIVTPEVDATCALYSEIYGLAFGDPDASLGGARTARLANERLLGVRAPMNETERPVTRPYLLVEDIEAAVAAAASAGAEITLPPMSIPRHGTCAIVYQGGIESGLWQV